MSLDRFETFASSTNGDEARILHLPSLRYDVLDRPLGASPALLGLGLVARLPQPLRAAIPRPQRGPPRLLPASFAALATPAAGASFPRPRIRDTSYSISQIPDLTDLRHGVPTISHEPLNRIDVEASLDIRPPALERDFVLARWNRVHAPCHRA